MATTARKEMEHIGETKGMSDHDHDLIHELSKRLDAVWRYDQYIANAEGKEELRDFWQNVKQQDQRIVDQLKQYVREEIDGGCF